MPCHYSALPSLLISAQFKSESFYLRYNAHYEPLKETKHRPQCLSACVHLQERSRAQSDHPRSHTHSLHIEDGSRARKRRHARRAARQARRTDITRGGSRRRRRRRRWRSCRRLGRGKVGREGARRRAAIRRWAPRWRTRRRRRRAVLDGELGGGDLVVFERVDWVAHILVDYHGHAFLTVADLAAVEPDWFGVVDLGRC
jgi:hypothetical protein